MNPILAYSNWLQEQLNFETSDVAYGAALNYRVENRRTFATNTGEETSKENHALEIIKTALAVLDESSKIGQVELVEKQNLILIEDSQFPRIFVNLEPKFPNRLMFVFWKNNDDVRARTFKHEDYWPDGFKPEKKPDW